MAEKRKLSSVFWVSIALLLLLAYPLSLGPVVWLDSQGMFSEAARRWIEVLYSPLLFLFENENIPLLPQLFESYVDWWDDLGLPYFGHLFKLSVLGNSGVF